MEILKDKDKIAKAFYRFHRENPCVYKELLWLSRELMRKGVHHYGIGALFEVIRYNRAIKTNSNDFKLNNNFRALYARLLMATEPDFENFFETRIRKARVRQECEEILDDLFDDEDGMVTQ